MLPGLFRDAEINKNDFKKLKPRALQYLGRVKQEKEIDCQTNCVMFYKIKIEQYFIN